MESLDGKPKYHVLGEDWYDADTLRDTRLFESRQTTRFSLVITHQLKQGKDFLYTAFSDPTAVKGERDNRSDRVLLSCAWVHNWLEVGKRPQHAVVVASRVSKRPRITEEEEEESASTEDLFKELDEHDEAESDDVPHLLLPETPMPDRVTVDMLPQIHLDEDDWFMGMNITFRGERHPDYIYARGPDVASLMGIRLTLKARKSTVSSNSITVYEGSKPVTYLRYIGLLSLLFSMLKKGVVEKFQRWATRVLFTFQFRPAAGTSMSRIPQSLCRPFFQVAVSGVAGLFACWIQSVDALRMDIRIPIELPGGAGRGVYRIGFTGNLESELAMLKRRFQTLSRSVVDDLQLVAFAHIDKSLFSAAQRDWDGMAAMLQGNYFQLFTADLGLYVLHESDVPTVRALALQLEIRFGSNIEHHIRLQVTNELMTAHQQEMEKLRLQHEREIMQLERALQKRA